MSQTKQRTRQALRAAIYDDGETHQLATEDAMSGDTIVRTYQDVEPHLEACKAERRADREHGLSKRGDWRKTMSVPFNVLHDICLKNGLDFFNPDHSKKIAGILKSSEYKYFRTMDKGT